MLVVLAFCLLVPSFGTQGGDWAGSASAESKPEEFQLGVLYSSRGVSTSETPESEKEKFRPEDIHMRLKKCFIKEYQSENLISFSIDEATLLTYRHLESAYGLTLAQVAPLVMYNENLERMSHTLNVCSHTMASVPVFTLYVPMLIELWAISLCHGYHISYRVVH